MTASEILGVDVAELCRTGRRARRPSRARAGRSPRSSSAAWRPIDAPGRAFTAVGRAQRRRVRRARRRWSADLRGCRRSDREARDRDGGRRSAGRRCDGRTDAIRDRGRGRALRRVRRRARGRQRAWAVRHRRSDRPRSKRPWLQPRRSARSPGASTSPARSTRR